MDCGSSEDSTRTTRIMQLRNKSDDETEKNRPTCMHCGKVINDRRNLNRHMKVIHGSKPTVRQNKLKCPMNESCEFTCSKGNILRGHLKNVHDFNCNRTDLVFSTLAEFETWKENEESTTLAHYVKDTGVKKRGKTSTLYLRCHRSGLSRALQNPQSQGRKRERPSKGYTQTGVTCPSMMQVTQLPGSKVSVIYYSSHLGHTLDSLKFMKLKTGEKKHIAAKLAQGESIRNIVLEARNWKGGRLERINLLRRSDVYNIKASTKFLEKEPGHDGRVLAEWVETMQGAACCSVVLHEPLTDSGDYFAVLVHPVQKAVFSLTFDGSIVYVKTKKGNLNVDFHLTTAFVVNNSGEGFPIAVCVSSKTDYATLLKFFMNVAKALGIVRSQVFISSNLNNCYIAWATVMGDCEHRLMCTFDLVPHWAQKLSAARCPMEKHEGLMRSLAGLLAERDAEAFHAALAEALATWQADDDLKPFAAFFDKVYAKRYEEWADCYRVHSHTNESLNRFLEPLNALVETVYRSNMQHVDACLNAMLLHVRNECLWTALDGDAVAMNKKLEEINNNHVLSLDHVQDVRESLRDTWTVSVEGSDHLVRKEESECEQKCGLVCSSCEICIHDYSCDCEDFVINFNVCWHVHATVMHLMEKTEVTTEAVSSTSALKFSAISMTKCLADHLESSELSGDAYVNIIMAVDKLVRDHFTKKST